MVYIHLSVPDCGFIIDNDGLERTLRDHLEEPLHREECRIVRVVRWELELSKQSKGGDEWTIVLIVPANSTVQTFKKDKTLKVR